jgi:HAD superfamily hydrolase (TIGR01509 family)
MSKCVLFDCDGTLVDSEGLCNKGLAIQFGELGVQLDPEELVVRFRGRKLETTLAMLRDEHQVELPDTFIRDYRRVVGELFESELRPVEGIEAVLQDLHQPMAVVSSGPVHKIQQALRVCGLTDYFGNNVYSSYEVGIWKPDPGIYLHAAGDMGFSARDCVVIEDSMAGVEAGLSAGIRTLFYNKFNEPCLFDKAICFSSMTELSALIANHER